MKSSFEGRGATKLGMRTSGHSGADPNPWNESRGTDLLIFPAWRPERQGSIKEPAHTSPAWFHL